MGKYYEPLKNYNQLIIPNFNRGKNPVMKKIHLYLLTLLTTAALLSGCEKDDPEVGYTAIGKAAGEWWVTYQVETSPGVLEAASGHVPLLSYNTSDNAANQIWLDEGNIWPFKVKSGFDGSNMSFSATNAASIVQSNNKDFTVTVTEGKVMLGGGMSKTKVVTDSIYFRAEFSDDPGTIYHISGHRRTGFLEDEY
jgi:hypothetical protein